MSKNNLVCDRCGMAKDTCFHSLESDYAVQTKKEFKRQMILFRFFALTLVSFLALIGYFICR